jgi:hypothetical protein
MMGALPESFNEYMPSVSQNRPDVSESSSGNSTIFFICNCAEGMGY